MRVNRNLTASPYRLPSWCTNNQRGHGRSDECKSQSDSFPLLFVVVVYKCNFLTLFPIVCRHCVLIAIPQEPK